MVPFLDVNSVLDDFKKYGVPMTIDETITVPMGEDPEIAFFR